MTQVLRKSLTITIAAASLLALAACDNYGSKQTIGALTGAAGGGLLGAQFGDGQVQLATTAAGTLAGALIGSEIGRSMDRPSSGATRIPATRARSPPCGTAPPPAAAIAGSSSKPWWWAARSRTPTASPAASRTAAGS